MPLFNPGIDATGGTITGNLSVSGTATVDGVLSAAGGTSSSGSAPVITPTFSSGVAAQLADTTRDYVIYIQLAGTGTGLSVAIGPTSTPANTIISSAATVAGEVFSVRLPASWYFKLTVTTATIASQMAVGC